VTVFAAVAETSPRCYRRAVANTEPINILSTGSLRLAGVLHTPAGEPSGLGVVVAHGMLSSKDSDKHRAFCEAAAGLGATALRFDFRGRGSSDGEAHDLTVSHEVEDMTAAIAHLRDLGHERIALVGSSLGGTVALLTAAADNDIAGLVTIAAPASLPKRPLKAWGGSGRTNDHDLVEVAPGERIHRRFFADAACHDPVAAATSIRCPWLIIHGDLDSVVPPTDAALLASRAADSILVRRATAGHRFAETAERSWLVDQVADFLAGLHW
jgi:pimeloyl-ACP methyl ester carboxylesterase